MQTPQYTSDPVYRALENLCDNAGVRVVYTHVPDDAIKGALWARADQQARCIEMPNEDCFESPIQAALVLGHELSHIVAEIESVDDYAQSPLHESMCDMLGSFLYKLAEMIAMESSNSTWRNECSEKEM